MRLEAGLPEENRKIAAQIRRLWADDLIRQIAEPLLGDRAPSVADIHPLIAAIADPKQGRGKRGEIAIWALGQFVLTAEQQEAAAKTLKEALDKELKIEQRRAYLGWLRLSLLIGAVVAGAIVFWTLDATEVTWSNAGLWFFQFIAGTLLIGLFVSPLLLPLSLAIDYHYCSRRGSVLLRALGNMRDPRNIGTLAAACKRALLRKTASSALLGLIPYLTIDHYARLDSRAVPNLCDLAYTARGELAMGALEALGKIGDGRAVYTVERLAARGKSSAIRQAAAQILPILQERQRAENAPGVLLRAANRPGSDVNNLLRPAEEAAPTDPQQLLRANITEEPSPQG